MQPGPRGLHGRDSRFRSSSKRSWKGVKGGCLCSIGRHVLRTKPLQGTWPELSYQAALISSCGKSGIICFHYFFFSEHIEEAIVDCCPCKNKHDVLTCTVAVCITAFPWLLPFHAHIHKWHRAILACGCVWGSKKQERQCKYGAMQERQ